MRAVLFSVIPSEAEGPLHGLLRKRSTLLAALRPASVGMTVGNLD
jgi:hypothetical protein